MWTSVTGLQCATSTAKSTGASCEGVRLTFVRTICLGVRSVICLQEIQGEGKRAFQVLVPCYESESLVEEQKKKSDDFLRLPKEVRVWKRHF